MLGRVWRYLIEKDLIFWVSRESHEVVSLGELLAFKFLHHDRAQQKGISK